MQIRPNPKQDDPHDVLVLATDAISVVPGREFSAAGSESVNHAADAQGQPKPDVGVAPSIPPLDASFRAAAVEEVLRGAKRRPAGGRVIRAAVGVALAACISLGAIAWQAKGDLVRRAATKWMPQLALNSATAATDDAAISEATAAAAPQASAADAAPPAEAAAATAPESAAAPAAGLSADQLQLLQSVSRDLAAVGQEIEQLKASMGQLKAAQEQMSREIAKASEQKLKPRTPPPAAAPRAAAMSSHRPAPLPPPSARPMQATAAPAYPPPPPPVSRPYPPQAQATAQPPADPELSPPRPPMPLR